MLARAFIGLFFALTAVVPAWADPVDDLAAALQFPRLFAVLEKESIGHTQQLEAELFPEGAGARWRADVGRIHEADRLGGQALAHLRQNLGADPEKVRKMVAYFTSDEGKRIVGAEIAAREAMIDEAVQEASNAALEMMEREQRPRIAQIDRLIEVHDLIEQNITGALNSSFAFTRGIFALTPAAEVPPEADLLSDIYAQEPAIREETTQWVRSYLALAYQPISDEALEGYIAFSASAEGLALNGALFGAFNAVFDAASEALGRASAIEMLGQDI